MLFQYWRTDRSQERTKGKKQLDVAGTAGIPVTVGAQSCGGCPSRLVVLVHCLEPVISIRVEFLLFFSSSSLYKIALSRHKKNQQHLKVPGKASSLHQLWGCAHCSCAQRFYLSTDATQPLPVAPRRANAAFPAAQGWLPAPLKKHCVLLEDQSQNWEAGKESSGLERC